MDYSDTRLQLLDHSNDKSFAKLTRQDIFDTSKKILAAAIPNIFSSFGGLLKDVISLYFVGHLNDALLFATFGFGMTWFSGFASSIIFGFAAGFGTLASQAFGARNYRKLGILYQRMLVLAAISIIFMWVFLCMTGPILAMIGYPEDLRTEVASFVKALLLDLVFYSIMEITKYYLVAQNIFNISAYILTFTSILHLFWCYLFTNVFNLELTGLAIARTITDATSAGLLLLYVKVKNPNPESWIPWNAECLKDLWSFTKELLSHGSSIYIEWITFELSTLMMAYLNDVVALAAYTATLNLTFLNFTLTFGFTIGTSTLVANAVGEGSPNKARKYAWVGLGLIMSLVTILDIILLFFKGGIPAFYTGEINVQNVMASMLAIYAFGMPVDIGSNALGYFLRATGQDKFVLRSFLFSYYMIGLVSCLVFGVLLGFGYAGIWWSLIAGFYTMFILNIQRMYYLDWEVEVKNVSNNLKSETTPSTSTLKEIEMSEKAFDSYCK